ncbi:MAG: hypothetical protein WA633_28130 [Stellaceae bacterium]
MFGSIGALIEKVLTAPTGTLLVIAGILSLFIAVAGNMSGKIEPGLRIPMMSAGHSD